MVIGDEDLPLVAGQAAAALAQRAAGVDIAFLAGPSVDVRAGIRRVGQRGVHRMIDRLHLGGDRQRGRVAECGVAHERVDRGETGVASLASRR